MEQKRLQQVNLESIKTSPGAGMEAIREAIFNGTLKPRQTADGNSICAKIFGSLSHSHTGSTAQARTGRFHCNGASQRGLCC